MVSSKDPSAISCLPLIICNRLATTTTNIIMACRDIEIDFIVQDNNPEMASVEDDIVENLKEIGIKVNTRVSYNTSETIMAIWQMAAVSSRVTITLLSTIESTIHILILTYLFFFLISVFEFNRVYCRRVGG